MVGPLIAPYAVAGVELGLGYAVVPAVRLEVLLTYRPRFTFNGHANFLAPVRLEFPILSLTPGLRHLILFMTATLCGPGGVRAVIAEHLLLKQQLLVLHRPRQRARAS